MMTSTEVNIAIESYAKQWTPLIRFFVLVQNTIDEWRNATLSQFAILL